MLMDLFYSTLPPSTKRKRRVHFHAFMIDVHKRVHAAKITMGHDGGDPILPVARDLANEAYVLCFDEFQACLVFVVSHVEMLTWQFSGHRHSGCHDSAAFARMPIELRRGLRYDVQVSPKSAFIAPSSHPESSVVVIQMIFTRTEFSAPAFFRRLIS